MANARPLWLPARAPDGEVRAEPQQRRRRPGRKLAQIVSDELGIPASDTKVVGQDLDRFGEGHGYVTSGGNGGRSAVRRTCGKIKEKSRYLAGGMLACRRSR